MFSLLFQLVGIVTLLTFAVGILAALFVALRGSSAGEPIRRARSILLKIAAGSFALAIMLTLLEFMVRVLNETP